MEVFKLFGRILVDDSEASKSLQKTDNNVKSVGSRLGETIKTAAKWGAALTGAAVAVGGAMFALTNKATQTADAIAKGAAKMGVSTDFYQEMDYWASQNGISHSSMERAIGRLNQRLGAAAQGNKKYSEALEKLGVDMDSVRDGTLSTEEAFAHSIQSLSQLTNEQEKSALAAELFGTKLARDLMPSLQDGSLSMEEAKQKAKELGLVISEDSLRAAEEFQDSWDSVKRSMGSIVTQIGLYMMPMFQTMLDFVLDNILPGLHELWNVFQDGEGIIGGFTNVLSSIFNFEGDGGLLAKLLAIARNAFTNVVDWLANDGIKMITSGLIEGRTALLDAAVKLFPAIVEGAGEFLPSLIDFIGTKLIPTILQLLMDGIPLVLNTAISVFNALIDAVVHILPGLLSMLLGEVLPNLVMTILSMIPIILDVAIELFNTLIDAVLTLLPQLLTVLLTDVLPNLLQTILSMIPELLITAIHLFTSLLDAVLTILPDLLTLLLVEVLPQLIITIVSMLPDIIAAAIQLFFGLITAILTVLPQLLITILTEVLPQLLVTILKMIPQLILAAIEVFLALVTGFIQAYPQLIRTIVKDIIPGIINALKSIDVRQIGRDIITGLWNGIASLDKWIRDKVRGFVSNIGGTIKSFFGISSPSKLMMEYGGNIGEGLGYGMESQFGNLKKVAENFTEIATPKLPGRDITARAGETLVASEVKSISGATSGSTSTNGLKDAIQVVVNLVVDGKVLARETAEATDEGLANLSIEKLIARGMI